ASLRGLLVTRHLNSRCCTSVSTTRLQPFRAYLLWPSASTHHRKEVGVPESGSTVVPLQAQRTTIHLHGIELRRATFRWLALLSSEDVASPNRIPPQRKEWRSSAKRSCVSFSETTIQLENTSAARQKTATNLRSSA